MTTQNANILEVLEQLAADGYDLSDISKASKEFEARKKREVAEREKAELEARNAEAKTQVLGAVSEWREAHKPAVKKLTIEFSEGLPWSLR